MISKEYLGRYEFKGSTEKGNPSNKFWWLIYDRAKGHYIAYWGRTSAWRETPQQTIYEGDAKALTKVKEKIKKGYVKKEGYEVEIGCNAENFIMKILAEESA